MDLHLEAWWIVHIHISPHPTPTTPYHIPILPHLTLLPYAIPTPISQHTTHSPLYHSHINTLHTVTPHNMYTITISPHPTLQTHMYNITISPHPTLHTQNITISPHTTPHTQNITISPHPTLHIHTYNITISPHPTLHTHLITISSHPTLHTHNISSSSICYIFTSCWWQRRAKSKHQYYLFTTPQSSHPLPHTPPPPISTHPTQLPQTTSPFPYTPHMTPTTPIPSPNTIPQYLYTSNLLPHTPPHINTPNTVTHTQHHHPPTSPHPTPTTPYQHNTTLSTPNSHPSTPEGRHLTAHKWGVNTIHGLPVSRPNCHFRPPLSFSLPPTADFPDVIPLISFLFVCGKHYSWLGNWQSELLWILIPYRYVAMCRLSEALNVTER